MVGPGWKVNTNYLPLAQICLTRFQTGRFSDLKAPWYTKFLLQPISELLRKEKSPSFTYAPLRSTCMLKHTVWEISPFMMSQRAVIAHWPLLRVNDNTPSQVFILPSQSTSLLPPSKHVEGTRIISISFSRKLKCSVESQLKAIFI